MCSVPSRAPNGSGLLRRRCVFPHRPWRANSLTPYASSMRAHAALWLLLGSLGACDGTAPNRAGKACSTDAQCDGLVCKTASDRVPEDLADLEFVCQPAHDGKQPGAACETGGDCLHGVCLLSGACAAPCTNDASCSPQQRCAAAYARSTTETLASLQACVARVDLPSDAQVATQVRERALRAGVAQLDLPPSAATPTLHVLEHLDDDTWPLPDSQSRCRPPLCARGLSTRDAQARVLFELAQLPADGPDNAVATGDYVNPLTVLLPNGPRAAANPAGYTLEVEAKRAGDLRITTLSRTQRGQRLDLNLYYVGARDLVASGDRGIPTLSAALEEVDRILAAADIFIGEVRQVEVHGALLDRGTPLAAAEVSQGFRYLRSQYQVLPQLPELFKLSAGAADIALDVFLVADIDAGGRDVGGISGGTPIPLGMHGTPGSGIVIAADMFLSNDDSKQLGRTIAHELCHALGLFHPTEADGRVFDPLPDTPVCPIDHDQNGDGILDARECAALGGDNLMFATSDAEDTQLTPEQINVLRQALILQ